jgi:hypothetical protein
VLAIAAAGAASVSEEEPAEWIPPSAEGTFADLSDDSARKASPARADAAASIPPAPAARPDAVPGFAASSTSGERPRSARPETTAPVTPLDDKLNAVLAEARRAAAGRGSGTFKRDDTAPDAAKAEARRAEALEKAIGKALDAEREERRQLAADLEKTLETAVEAERDERRQLAANIEGRLEAGRNAHDAASQKTGETLEALQSGMAAAAARADEALAAVAALKAEAGEQRSGLAGAIAAERAARESAEAAAGEAAISLAAQVAALTDRLQAAQAAAEESRTAATASLDRARRIEDVLRAALRDLTS